MVIVVVRRGTEDCRYWYGWSRSRLDSLFICLICVYSSQFMYGYWLIVAGYFEDLSVWMLAVGSSSFLWLPKCDSGLEFSMDYWLIVVVLTFGFATVAPCNVLLCRCWCGGGLELVTWMRLVEESVT